MLDLDQARRAIRREMTTALDVPPVSVVEPRALPMQLDAAHEQLWAALVDRTVDDLASPAAMPYGPVPLALFLQVVAMEVGVHHSDLRAALGLPDDLGADVARATAAFLAAFLPALAASGGRPAEPVRYVLRGRSFELEWSSGEGAAQTVTLSGDDSDLCLFVLGRRTVEEAELTVDGDPALAARFKEFVPGP